MPPNMVLSWSCETTDDKVNKIRLYIVWCAFPNYSTCFQFVILSWVSFPSPTSGHKAILCNKANLRATSTRYPSKHGPILLLQDGTPGHNNRITAPWFTKKVQAAQGQTRAFFHFTCLLTFPILQTKWYTRKHSTTTLKHNFFSLVHHQFPLLETQFELQKHKQAC